LANFAASTILSALRFHGSEPGPNVQGTHLGSYLSKLLGMGKDPPLVDLIGHHLFNDSAKNEFTILRLNDLKS